MESKLSYESICTLIGRIVLENHAKHESFGHSFADLQNKCNTYQQRIAQLESQIIALQNRLGNDNEAASERVTN